MHRSIATVIGDWRSRAAAGFDIRRGRETPQGYPEQESELSLGEMLADPIVQTLMVRDGVTEDEVQDLIASARRKASVRPIEERDAGISRIWW